MSIVFIHKLCQKVYLIFPRPPSQFSVSTAWYWYVMFINIMHHAIKNQEDCIQTYMITLFLSQLWNKDVSMHNIFQRSAWLNMSKTMIYYEQCVTSPESWCAPSNFALILLTIALIIPICTKILCIHNAAWSFQTLNGSKHFRISSQGKS